jgi:DnaK suppressor protein
MINAPTLNQEQFQDLKSILEHRHDSLQKQESLDFGSLINTAKDGLEPESDESAASDANASAEQALSARHLQEMHAIENAFLRMQQNTYGRCVDCQSIIDYARLLAYPTALRCMSCQESFEIVENRRAQ